MRPLTLVPYYIAWHYSIALHKGLKLSRNFIWFFWHFFSISILLGTLFAPWERMHVEKESGLELSKYASAITVNLIIRCVGAIIRSAFIITGLFCILVTVALTIVLLCVWVALPLVIITLFALGIIFFLHRQ